MGLEEEGGNLFRGDAAQPSGSQWTPLEGTNASGTAPHPDSRDLVFDAAGNLLESDDGGLYRLVNPGLPSRHWVSVEGNLQDTEFYSVGYDSLAHVAGGGAQDQGSALQSTPGGTHWTEVVGADGGTVAVDNSSLPGRTLVYGGAQNLSPLLQGTFDATGVPVGPGRQVALRGYDPNDRQFITPFVLNAVDPSRMLLGGNSHIYESSDRGDDVNAVATIGTTDAYPESLAYGGWLGSTPNPDVAYVASPSGLFVRTGPAPDPFVQSTSFPGTSPLAVALDPEDWRHAYVIDGSHLYVTTDAGQSWMDISGNLAQLDTLLPGVASPDLRSLVVLNPSPGTVEVLVGGLGGVYQATDPGPNTAWSYLGTNLPHAPVQSLVYNARDNVVLAGTFGRGLWLAPAVPLTLTGLSTTSVGQGSSDLLLTVSGTGFAATSAVTWNGVALPTAYVSGTELQALLPAADLALAGTAALGVARSLPLAEVSNTLTFTVTPPSIFPLVVQAPSAQLLGGTLVLDLSAGHNVLALFRHSHHRVLVLLNGHLRGLFRANTLVLFGGLGDNIIVVSRGLRLPLFLSSGTGSNIVLDSHGVHQIGSNAGVVLFGTHHSED